MKAGSVKGHFHRLTPVESEPGIGDGSKMRLTVPQMQHHPPPY